MVADSCVAFGDKSGEQFEIREAGFVNQKFSLGTRIWKTVLRSQVENSFATHSQNRSLLRKVAAPPPKNFCWSKLAERLEADFVEERRVVGRGLAPVSAWQPRLGLVGQSPA